MTRGSTLFLDRDGVLNERIMGGYVTSWNDFHWLPGVLEALAKARLLFEYIMVVTNQQGVGKGLMSVSDLQDIHDHLLEEAAAAGGAIDHVYSCTSLASAHDPRRKPEVGMIEEAVKDFPGLDISKSILIGDTQSDLQLARNAGMKAIWIDHGVDNENVMPPFNYRCGTLLNAIGWLEQSGILDAEVG